MLDSTYLQLAQRIDVFTRVSPNESPKSVLLNSCSVFSSCRCPITSTYWLCGANSTFSDIQYMLRGLFAWPSLSSNVIGFEQSCRRGELPHTRIYQVQGDQKYDCRQRDWMNQHTPDRNNRASLHIAIAPTTATPRCQSRMVLCKSVGQESIRFALGTSAAQQFMAQCLVAEMSRY